MLNKGNTYTAVLSVLYIGSQHILLDLKHINLTYNQSLLGTNPLDVTVSIYPLYRLDFVNANTVLCSIDNTNGTDCLNNTVTKFSSAMNCTSIHAYYNGNLI